MAMENEWWDAYGTIKWISSAEWNRHPIIAFYLPYFFPSLWAKDMWTRGHGGHKIFCPLFFSFDIWGSANFSGTFSYDLPPFFAWSERIRSSGDDAQNDAQDDAQKMESTWLVEPWSVVSVLFVNVNLWPMKTNNKCALFSMEWIFPPFWISDAFSSRNGANLAGWMRAGDGRNSADKIRNETHNETRNSKGKTRNSKCKKPETKPFETRNFVRYGQNAFERKIARLMVSSIRHDHNVLASIQPSNFSSLILAPIYHVPVKMNFSKI